MGYLENKRIKSSISILIKYTTIAIGVSVLGMSLYLLIIGIDGMYIHITQTQQVNVIELILGFIGILFIDPLKFNQLLPRVIHQLDGPFGDDQGTDDATNGIQGIIIIKQSYSQSNDCHHTG